MHAFSVAPFDQNLSIDGKSLTDDSATLGSLGVIPESIICLKVHPTFLPLFFTKNPEPLQLKSGLQSGYIILLILKHDFHRFLTG